MGNINKIVSKTYYRTRLIYNTELSQRLNWFKNNEHLSQEQIQQLQWSLLSQILDHAEQNVPYYRDLFKKLDLHAKDIRNRDDFVKLPLLTKQDIKENLERLVANNFLHGQLIRSGTGGSTGVPVPFYHDRQYYRFASALSLRNLMWTGWQYGEPRLKIWGSAFDIKPTQKLIGRFFSWMENQILFPAFDMSEEHLNDWTHQIEQIHPVVVEGYTNPLVALASHAERLNIRLNDLDVRAVINAAETLFDNQRELLKKIFGCKVYNRYGGRELSTIAHECEVGSLHINQDWVYLEIVDDLGMPVKPGGSGQIVLTGLFTFGMPFIRYAVQDIGAFPMHENLCSCGRGFSILEHLEGRIQDLIVLPEGGYLAGEFFAHLFKDFDICQYQVVQKTKTKMEIKLVYGPTLTDYSLNYLRSKIHEFAPGIELEFYHVSYITTSASGKFRSTISLVHGSGT
jgi:phenylacetate-CoA ligase